jgi:hypothetical protein
VNERLQRALRRKIEAHNRLANLSTAGAALGVLLLWSALHFVIWWLTVLFRTARDGLDAQPPAQIHRVILISFLILLAVGWFFRQRGKAGVPEDQNIFERLFGLVLIPPNVTFAVWDNFQARVRLAEIELIAAAAFLERLFRAGKMTADNVATEIPDPTMREHVLTALRTTELVHVREIKGEEIISIVNPERLIPFVQA